MRWPTYAEGALASGGNATEGGVATGGGGTFESPPGFRGAILELKFTSAKE